MTFPENLTVSSLEHLRTLYALPGERALKKQITALDHHCRKFIQLSPFVVVATANEAGALDASPRGGVPGFAKISAQGQLLIPDAPGNNRLDTLQNLLFLIPGVDETLRVNGTATLSVDPRELELCADDRRAPKVVVRVRPQEVFLHCAKALMRSRLWDATTNIDRATLPTMGQMVKEHAGLTNPAESQEDMLRRYEADL
jgi:hypothetical protein